MEGKRQVSSSTSSFTADLFGTKESQPPSSSSSGLFASILSPPSMVKGRNSSNPETIGSWQKQSSGNEAWNNKQGNEGASCNIPNKGTNSIFQEERAEPCHLSSSLYYGGQEIYSHSSSNTYTSSTATGSYPTFKKEGREEDGNGNNSHGASRGNWWQGSLYY